MGQAKQRGSYQERVAQAQNNNLIRQQCQQEHNLSNRFFNKMMAHTGNDVTLCDYQEQPYARQLRCFDNAEQYAKMYGGRVVYGWMLMPFHPDTDADYKRIGIAEMQQHAVVKKDNKIICVTPYDSTGNEQIGKFGGDCQFNRYFWQDDKCILPNRYDNLMFIPNTGSGRGYQKEYPDIQHIELGELGNLIPENYPEYYRTKQATEQIVSLNPGIEQIKVDYSPNNLKRIVDLLKKGNLVEEA
jgi:hypothetical protein